MGIDPGTIAAPLGVGHGEVTNGIGLVFSGPADLSTVQCQGNISSRRAEISIPVKKKLATFTVDGRFHRIVFRLRDMNTDDELKLVKQPISVAIYTLV